MANQRRRGLPLRVSLVAATLVLRPGTTNDTDASDNSLLFETWPTIIHRLFAAHDAVVVEDTDFDVFELAFLDDFAGVCRGADVFGLHGLLFLYMERRAVWGQAPFYGKRLAQVADLANSEI